jgi:D-xylonolactonase
VTEARFVPELVASYGCLVGENPRWHQGERRLYWLDIDSGRLFRLDPATGEHECFYRGPVVGGFTFQADGSLLLFEADRIVSLDRNLSRRVLKEGIDPDMTRFNDCIADPEGRVFVGTIGRTAASGGLYRVDRDLQIRCLWKGTGCSNGMAFTGDLRHCYWTCSTTRTIDRSEYDRETGTLTGRTRFYRASPDEGAPDGLTIDRSDHLWSARWGGSAVLEIDGAGQVVGKLELPVERVSAATFGGTELDTLYVTTAGGSEESPGADGALYRVRLETRGRAEHRSQIGL